jgi:hypothetical protein
MTQALYAHMNNKRKKRAGGMAQEAEYLPSKQHTLSSTSSTANKNKKPKHTKKPSTTKTYFSPSLPSLPCPPFSLSLSLLRTLFESFLFLLIIFQIGSHTFCPVWP